MTHPTDEELDALVKRLSERAKEDRQIQANNEAVAVALKGQKLLFEQGVKSKSNSFAVRLSLDYENCAKKDAQIASDWEAAAYALTALRAQLAEAKAGKEKLGRELNLARYGQPDFSWQVHKEALAAANARADRAEEEVRRLKAAIFGSENYAPDLKCGNFVEMAETLHAAQKGGLERAERAEAALAALTFTAANLEREGPDNFERLVRDGIEEAIKAMRKFPQPNYIISKIAEEAGEVVKAAIHCAEGRETPENLRGEMKQLIAMLYRLWIEGDRVHGLGSVSSDLAQRVKE